MTRKDYGLLAHAVSLWLARMRKAQRTTTRSGRLTYLIAEALIGELCVALKGENQRFDEEKFRKACGL